VHRFFAPSLDAGDETVVLPRDEAEHLTRVLRIAAGDEVAVFDGRGHEYRARVIGAVRRDVRVQLLTRIEPAAELPVAVTLVQAILKGDKMDEVVRDAVMLGVGAIQPIVTRRTEVTIAAILRGARLDRWRRIALASVKQSRRAILPEIRTPLTFETYLDELRGAPLPSDASVIVGPEGGWDEREWAAAQASGVRLISLGHRTLRADAVPIAALSVLNFLWDGTP
jgi:16S rRNA (uracil1498-N3)-methyltransferase